jgi:hypothetical protein
LIGSGRSEQDGQVLGRLGREAAGDVATVHAADPIGVLLEVDERHGAQLVVCEAELDQGGTVFRSVLRCGPMIAADR